MAVYFQNYMGHARVLYGKKFRVSSAKPDGMQIQS
jgi:hypothetical protein